MTAPPGRIRVLPIPPNQPPALPPGADRTEVLRPMFVQDALALDFRGERDRVEVPTGQNLPDPAAWVRGVAQALIEVMAGIRPPASVVRLTTPPVYVAVARRYGVTVRRAATRAQTPRHGPAAGSQTGGRTPQPALVGRSGPRRLAVLRVHCSRTKPDIAEVAVVLADGSRVRAMALELTALAGGWRVSALQIA